MNSLRLTVTCLCLGSLVACQNADTSNWSASPLDRPSLGGHKAAVAQTPEVLPPLQPMPNTTPLPPEPTPAAPGPRPELREEDGWKPVDKAQQATLPSHSPATTKPETPAKEAPKVDANGKMRMPNMLDLPNENEFRPKTPKPNDGGVIVRPPEEKR